MRTFKLLILPQRFSEHVGVHSIMPRTLAPWEISRKSLTKAEDKTDPSHGHRPEERPTEEYILYGVINLDKPAGPTSHEVAAWVKRILKLKQVGHGGTLEA
jgi:H/ACA ribonucleoprotein complex subunit 4